jgi:Fe-S-cluster containining protein
VGTRDRNVDNTTNDRNQHIDCIDCAAACCRLEVLCIGDHDIPSHLTEHDADGYLLMRRLDDGWCAALNRTEMNCGIYARRPLPCRELEMGGPECLAARARLAAEPT